MLSRNRTFLVIQVVRHLAAAICVWEVIDLLWHTISAIPGWKFDSISSIFLNVLFVIPFAFAWLCGFSWLAWRLWARWNAATIRWVVGVLLAVGILMLSTQIAAFFSDAPGDPRFERISSVAMLVFLLLGGWIFHLIAPRLIHLAELDEPYDLYGQPPGHQTRVRVFAVVLGLMVFFTGSHFLPAPSNKLQSVGLGLPPELTPVIGLLFVPLGIASYRLTLWWMKPRTLPAMKAEHSFEVLVKP